MEQDKEYYAFISYKREDEKWAKWLQHKLEHYKFPTNLNGRTDLPKRIYPTFRDVTDLTPGLLAEEIDTALRNSQWLIVVCSPRSAKSPWVCKEAQTFIDLGRADHIIPFVIEGNPFSKDSDTECYPEALLNLTGNQELLATNINEMGRDAAAIKVVARMFGLKFDTLWQRYEREQRHRMLLITLAAMGLAILGLVIGGIFVNKNRVIANTNKQLEAAADQLRKDSIDLANHIKTILEDSVLLSQQKDSITNANIMLKKERNNLAIANKQALMNESKALAALAIMKCDKGDYIEGRRLALAALPKILSSPERPFVIEAEAALRRAFERDFYYRRTLKPTSEAVSPNGDLIAHADPDGIEIKDSKTGESLYYWKYVHGQDSPLEIVSYNKDGSSLLFPTWDGAVIADSRNGSIIDTLPNPGYLTSVQYSRDFSKILTLTYNNDLKIFNALDRKKILYEKKLKEDQQYALFDPNDDNKILIAGNDELEMLDMALDESRIYSLDESGIKRIDIHPQGRYIAIDNREDEFFIWDLTEGKKIITLNDSYIREFAFDKDGRYLYVKDGYGKDIFYDVYSWQKHSFDDSPKITDREAPIKYSSVEYAHDDISYSIILHNDYYNSQGKVPEYIRSALKHEKWGLPYVTKIIQSDSNISIVDYSYEGHGDVDCCVDYAAVFKGRYLIRTFEIILGEDDRLSGSHDLFLNYDGKYYGYRNDEGVFRIFETKTGRLAHSFENSWGEPLIFDKYIIVPDFREDTDGFTDILVIDIKSGVEVQRLKDFSELPGAISIVVDKSNIYFLCENERVCYKLRPLQELIDEAVFQFRNYGKRKIIYSDFTRRKEELELFEE